MANRANGADVETLSELTGLAAVAVPDDPAVAQADREGLAPIDVDPQSPALLAIASLAEQLGLVPALAAAQPERRG